jgi:hypothetical protein
MTDPDPDPELQLHLAELAAALAHYPCHIYMCSSCLLVSSCMYPPPLPRDLIPPPSWPSPPPLILPPPSWPSPRLIYFAPIGFTPFASFSFILFHLGPRGEF